MTQVSDSTAQSALANSGSTARILIVDDEQYMCDICARTLQGASYDVVATTDVKVAVQELRGFQPFDLLLADIKMPTMSGIELAQKAREVDPAIAIIIMTGHASVENLHQAVRRGVADFITKPFELEQLRLVVEQALHKRQLLQDSLRLQAVEQLLSSSEALNATLDRNALSHIIIEAALQQTQCQAGFLLLSNQNRRRLRLTLTQPAQWRLLEPGRAIATQVLRSGQTCMHEQEEALCTDGEQSLNRGLVAPLRAQGETIAVLLLCDDRPNSLRLGTQEIVTLLANYAGTALHNAHLYGELERAYQRSQEFDRLKSEFIAIASHELRTPLSIVLGYATMVRNHTEGEQREYAQRVLASAQRIKDIVDDMVDLRHLELRETPLNLERCEAHDLVSQAAARMLPAARSKEHELTLDLPEESMHFMADREKILLILGNLIANAIKFTPNHGTIVISVALYSHEQIHAESPDSPTALKIPDLDLDDSIETWVVFQVCDNGIGIPEREQARIFERFYQVATSLTRAHGGLGLGLAIVRELVTLQGGAVWVESVEGQGSVFSVILPYRLQ